MCAFFVLFAVDIVQHLLILIDFKSSNYSKLPFQWRIFIWMCCLCNASSKWKANTVQLIRHHFNESIKFFEVCKCVCFFGFLSFVSKQRHKLYVIRYFGCELLCLINIIVQMWMMDRFFDGEFLSYGWRVMNLADQPQEQRYDPMVRFFLDHFFSEILNLF